MTENTQLNNSENVTKKWTTSMEDTGSQNGRTGDQCGTCEAVEGDEDRTAGSRREIPQSQELQHCPRAHNSGQDPAAIPAQSQEKSEILEGKQEISLHKRLDALDTEKTEIEMYLQVLKRRSHVINNTSNSLKQEVSELYDEMRQKLAKDEQETIELIEENSRIAVGKLNKAIKERNQHLEHIRKLIKSVQTELQQKWRVNTKQVDELQEHGVFNKKTFAGEQFEINTSKFQKLLKLLKNISENLQAKFLQKSLLLDQTPVLLDITTSNKNLYISSDQTGMCLLSEPQNIPNSPLRFDAMCYALASSGWMRGRHYWEVDVRSSPAWSIGMAYGSIERKGKPRSGKLGRNRLSWCLELKDNKLLAWHNDKAILCGKGLTGLKQVGVHVDCERSKIIFYNAKSMKAVQEFSSATAPFFDRLQHQFTEAVFPALGLFPPKSGPITFERLQICNSSDKKPPFWQM